MFWSVQDIVKEISDVGTLLKSRLATTPPDAMASFEKLKEAMTKGISNKIMSLRLLSAHEAIELQNALTSSELQAATRVALQQSIDSKLAIGCDMVAAGVGKPAIKPQMLTGIINYPTAQEWADLLNRKNHISVR